VVNVRARFCCFSLDKLSGLRVALFGFGLMPNHFQAVLELVLAVLLAPSAAGRARCGCSTFHVQSSREGEKDVVD
jgi:hypothetical protein